MLYWPFHYSAVHTFFAGFVRKILVSNSRDITLASKAQIKSLQEGLGSIRDVLLDSSQQIYVSSFRYYDRRQRLLIAKNQFLGSFPRFILEALGLIFIVLLGTVLVVINGPGYNVVPTLGALALGSQRLLPSLQQIYKSWAAINGYKSSIEDLISMLRLPIPQEYLYPSKFAYPFSNAIEFNNVSFSYSGTNTLF